ncbi:hypothetical protein [Corynebacterium rouxii]|uniref:Uncharacterized protein n=1 Tax=Corynebacterium rouxii TaxID=2719119 RepID=A0A6I8MCS1_9CORY|nr:hypothetical protein [Corynebacterium rouxii]MDT9407765.1 hypothetical protein [Corynebacterium rouxii]MDT9409946.1 hypothetical protein [Corynebacterium rouxii]VZH84021.1 hypothetical protein FRC0190_00068 [Corynebacterium rouxii]
MPIGAAKNKVEKAEPVKVDSAIRAKQTTKKATRKATQKTAASALKGFEERATTLRIYVKNADYLKELKMAALEDDTSLSQLFEDWSMDWLSSRKK